MYFHNPHVLAEQSRQHRAELEQQAHAQRLARGFLHTRPPFGRRLLASLGARLVRWGTRLQEPAAHAHGAAGISHFA